MKKGDLVMWKSYRFPNLYGVIIDVEQHGGVYPEEVLVKFPLDGSQWWVLSKNLEKMEKNNE